MYNEMAQKTAMLKNKCKLHKSPEKCVQQLTKKIEQYKKQSKEYHDSIQRLKSYR